MKKETVWSKEGKVVDHLIYLGERHTEQTATNSSIEIACQHQKSVNFDATITRKKIILLGESKKRTTIAKNNKTKTVAVNRDILGKLLSATIPTGRAIDLEKAM